MGKRLDITPKISAAIARSTDDSVDPNTVAVYETISMNTLPIHKKGSIFHGATATESLLKQMADFVNAPGGFVPLHNNHDQGMELPVGRVFAGESRQTETGTTELRTLFYLPLSEDKLIGKIESGTVEEVSVGVQPKHLNCSECGFDYMGPEATFDNFWNQTCNNDHTIGENGVHLNLVGLDRFYEQSIVSLGAAHKAKMQPRAKALIGVEQYAERLAATGIAPEATVLFASPTKEELEAMDISTLVAELTTAKANNQVNDAAIKAANDTIATLTKTNKDLQDRIEALEAAADTKLPEVQAQLEASQKTLADATDVMRTEAVRLSTAAGLEQPADDATIATLSGAITTARAKLATMIPVGGVSLRSETGSGDQAAYASALSFKTR